MRGMEDVVRGLPSDPFVALYRFAQWVSSQNNSNAEGYIRVRTFYESFIKRYSIPINLDDISAKGTQKGVVEYITSEVLKKREILLKSEIEVDIDNLIGEYESATSLDTFGIARLNSDEKQKIHASINKIRTVIDESPLSERKKNALYKKLDDLAHEVDRIGTKTDAFFAFMGDVAFVMGDMAKKSKPLLDEVKDMIKVIGRARARQEGVSLPPGDTPLSLPAPDEE